MTYKTISLALGIVGMLAACSSPRPEPATESPAADASTEHASMPAEPKTDEEITKVALSAAPADVAAGAAIVEPNADGTMREIRPGTNGYVCMVGLIRFGGHLPKGGYDVDHGGQEAEASSA